MPIIRRVRLLKKLHPIITTTFIQSVYLSDVRFLKNYFLSLNTHENAVPIIQKKHGYNKLMQLRFLTVP